MNEITNIRNEFPILEHKIQLSSCSQSALHKNVKSSINQYINSWENDGMDWELWMEVCEDARKKFAQLINAKPSEVAIVSSVSHAISSVAVSLQVEGEKNELLVAENDFPCIGHVALSQNDKNVKFVDYARKNSLQENISENTLLVSVPHVSFYNGAINNIADTVRLAKENNSLVFVDAYQSAGQLDIDVKEMDVDFLAAGMQKYLLGIPGIAFLYVKEEVAEKMTPKITGWFGQENPFSFDGKNVTYANGAIRFDSGTFPMINGFAASSALEILLKIGVKNIEKYLQELSSFTLEYSQQQNLHIASPLDPKKKGSNTAIFVPNANELEAALRKENILLSARNDVIRIAPHFYNTKEEIIRAIDTIVRFT